MFNIHLAVDAESELPLAFTVTPANIYDSTEYPRMILELLMQEGLRPKTVLADAGYDSKENYRLALECGAVPIIAINKRNLKKKNTRDFEQYLPIQRNSELWKSLYRKRSSAERVVSRLKEESALKDLKVRGLNNVRNNSLAMERIHEIKLGQVVKCFGDSFPRNRRDQNDSDRIRRGARLLDGMLAGKKADTCVVAYSKIANAARPLANFLVYDFMAGWIGEFSQNKIDEAMGRRDLGIGPVFILKVTVHLGERG